MATTISALIASTESGDRSAADALFAALYGELHTLAQRQLARRGSDLTLGVTTLLHEAYLDMAQREGSVFPDKGRFMAYAARVMRSLIIDYARNHRALKRGGEFQITTLEEDAAIAAAGGSDLEGVGARSRKAHRPRSDAGGGRGPQVLLRFLARRDRRHARRVRADDAAADGRRRGSTCAARSGTRARRAWLERRPLAGPGAASRSAPRSRRVRASRRARATAQRRIRSSPRISTGSWRCTTTSPARKFLEDAPAAPPRSASLAGQTVGAYTLVEPIGQGGMGSVWLAQRSDGRFEGRVAVKLLNASLVGRAGEERFRREGSILARLAHPHIARLLDAGVSEWGQPYLVLEYVDGEPIDRYCDDRRLDVEARLRLFLDVAEAVSLAHANLVVHRDIKPSNVLVGKDGQVRAPRLRHRQAPRGGRRGGPRDRR